MQNISKKKKNSSTDETFSQSQLVLKQAEKKKRNKIENVK